MKFSYSGPVSGICLPGKTGEIVLIDGQAYDLPEQQPDVLRLIQQGYLTPQADQLTPVLQKGADNAG